MSDEPQQTDFVKKTIVLEIPGMDAVTVRRDVEYRVTDTGALTMDIYSPPDGHHGEPRPAVVFVSGYPDPGLEAVFGCKLKDTGAYISWARLVAASGLVAVTYTNHDPAADVQAVLDHLRDNAAALGIDSDRIGVWSCSGNVPTALSVLMSDRAACAVLCYGYMLDLDASTSVATAAAHFHFATPCAGKSVADIPRDAPLFVVRAGQDQMPAINQTIDQFLAHALARNLPVTVINHAAAPHAFDLMDDSDTTREVIRQIVHFLRFQLVK